MADHYGQAKASDVQPNGLLPGDVSSVTQVLDAERWSIAERRTAKLIAQIQPNKPSEERRKAVASYVERLITKTFPCQVFTFGSVPLKTYLPDGDIDLSAFSNNLQLKDTWANELRQVLENEEKNENAEFHVKEVQYIQAEVKIIKCLIENIVVDVSFNQLGGLCTLCFLEAIDHLIDQDHLFKRSIILIKAWCYYESRILGAHHGLISTYALETLVLYIFHVFNNSFSGPLEVLYRFLEFFSYFDWENFCVSLWGPVPISSLPDTTAEPPRKNSGELLLSKSFYDVCNRISPALSNSQESQSQPFVSKHFNVIDPLRTNNNLGRSVSKGNFYRIRSALAFGAKRLAGLLECSTNILVDEIDNFFINTWRRHGSGHRPDLPNPVLRQLQPLSADTTEDSENVKNHVNREMRSEAFDLHAGCGYPNDGSMAFGGISSRPVKARNKSTQNMLRTSSPSSCSNIHDSYGYQTSYGISDQIERTIDGNEFAPADEFPKMSNPDIFQRTHSSPELTGPSAKIFSRVRQSMELDEKKQITSEKPTQSNGRKNLGSEFPGGHSRVSIDSSFSHGLSERGLGFHASDSNIVLDGYHHDAQFSSLNELASASDAMQMQHKMHQDEQDLINMMASSSFNSSNGWVQQPTNISSHPRVPFHPVLVPNGYSQRCIGGLIPSSTTLIHPPGSITQFPEARASSHYCPNAGLESNQEATLESVNDSSSMTEVEQEDSDRGFWPEQNAGSGRGFLPDKKNIQFQITNSDDKQLPSLGGFKSIPSNSSDSNGPSVRGQNKLVRGDRRSIRDDHNDAPVCPNNKEKDLCSTDTSAYSRLLPACSDTSSRSESVSDFSDFSSKKVPKSGIDRRRKKQGSFAALASSSYNKEKSGWRYEDSSSDHVSVLTDEDNRECVTPASRIAEMAEPSTFSSSLATAPVQGCQVSGSNPALINRSESVIPVSPVLLCTGSQQRGGDDSGGAPIAFFPAGPLVSIVMVPFPFYKTPSDSDNSGESRDQLEVQGTSLLTPSGQSYDVGHEDPDSFITSSSVELSSSNQGEGHNPDILNSDLVGHWQNLQFGRFCHTPSQGPLVRPSPAMVPQMHLQGHFPLDGSRGPPAKNFNAVSQIMSSGHQFIPFMPPQPGSSRPSGLNQNYREEVPRFRGGTGTYLPDPKVSFRDRQTPGTRHHRGNFHHDWNEHDDREGNWSSSKSRYRGRSHVRTQVDRPYSRVNQSSTFENKADRPWDSHRHGRIAYYPPDNSSFGSMRSKHGSASVAHGMRALPAVKSKCINRSGPAVPPAVELYPSVPIAFAGDASIGQVGNNVPWSSDGGRTVGMSKHSHDKYQEGSSHTSQD